MAEREIKFRGMKTFQIFSGETRTVWLYGFFLKRGTYGDPGPQAHIFIYENGYEGYRVDEKTIGQFTGFLDVQGEEIYEDDIVSCEDGRQGIVAFQQGTFVVYGRNGKSVGALSELWEIGVEIVGNRFEQPELLELKSKVCRRKTAS